MTREELANLDDIWLTAPDVARLTGWHRSTVYRKWHTGELPSFEPTPGNRRMTLGQFRQFTAQMQGKIQA